MKALRALSIHDPNLIFIYEYLTLYTKSIKFQPNRFQKKGLFPVLTKAAILSLVVNWNQN